MECQRRRQCGACHTPTKTRRFGIDYVAFDDGTQLAFSALLDAAGLNAQVDPHFGDDTVAGSGYLWGGPGADTLQAELSPEPIGFGPGGIPFSSFQSMLTGGAGHDTLRGSDDNDLLLGNDIVSGLFLRLLRPVTNLWDDGNVYEGRRRQ